MLLHVLACGILQLASLEQAVAALEADGGVSAPTTLPGLDGKWRLLYTSRPGTASPIQRSFTGVDAFAVFQEVRPPHLCAWACMHLSYCLP